MKTAKLTADAKTEEEALDKITGIANEIFGEGGFTINLTEVEWHESWGTDGEVAWTFHLTSNNPEQGFMDRFPHTYTRVGDLERRELLGPPGEIHQRPLDPPAPEPEPGSFEHLKQRWEAGEFDEPEEVEEGQQ